MRVNLIFTMSTGGMGMEVQEMDSPGIGEPAQEVVGQIKWFDTTKGYAVIYYDADPKVAGGVVAELDNITTPAKLHKFAASDFPSEPGGVAILCRFRIQRRTYC